jgi:hypothetical protein
VIARDVAIELAKNAAMGFGPIRRRRLHHARTAPARVGSSEQLERYAFQALRTISRCRDISDANIIEFGPGDNLASGLAMLAAGARSYVALDRFVSDYASKSAKEWYGTVEECWRATFPERPWPVWLRSADFPEAYRDRVDVVAAGVENAAVGRTFDVVCSFQVGEHVKDVAAFGRLTAALLAPEGIAVHRVDFGPHDCWRRYPDPLTFMRFSPRLWRAMGSNRGYPNRLRHPDVMRLLQEAGLTVDVAERHAFATAGLDVDPTADAIYVCRHAPQPDFLHDRTLKRLGPVGNGIDDILAVDGGGEAQGLGRQSGEANALRLGLEVLPRFSVNGSLSGRSIHLQYRGA